MAPEPSPQSSLPLSSEQRTVGVRASTNLPRYMPPKRGSKALIFLEQPWSSQTVYVGAERARPMSGASQMPARLEGHLVIGEKGTRIQSHHHQRETCIFSDEFQAFSPFLTLVQLIQKGLVCCSNHTIHDTRYTRKRKKKRS